MKYTSMLTEGKKIIILSSILLMIFAVGFFSYAQENEEIEIVVPVVELDYGNELIIDSDLDGLTDLGEEKIFQTDKLNPDSDGDGIYDGTEVLSKTDPLSNLSPAAEKIIAENVDFLEREIPWAWYVVRASGIVSFAILWWVMFTGLAIRMPVLNKILKPIYSMNMHRWLSVQAIFFAAIHGGGLLFDKFMNFSFSDAFVPFVSDFRTELVTLGILGFYLMIILTLTSYFRRHISFGIWRLVHYFNIVLYVIVIVHALLLGTDMQNEIVKDIFLGINGVLILLIVANIFMKIKNAKFKS